MLNYSSNKINIIFMTNIDSNIILKKRSLGINITEPNALRID